MKKLLTPLLLILFTLPSFASDLPPCLKGKYHNCFGTYTWANGSKYVGEFNNRKYYGKGTFTFPNGNKYVGEFKDGKRNGKGTYTGANGNKYVGEFKDDKRNGKGTYTGANGNKYVGEFKDDKSHGKGTYTWANGTVKSGIWADDEYLYDLAEHQKREKRRLTLLRQKEKQKREAQSRRQENDYRARCARDAGKAGTEYAAKQIEKTCLETHGLKPKGWFD